MNTLARLLFVFLLGVSLTGCDGGALERPALFMSDLDEAQAAARDGEWTRAQRYLERYLRSEEDPNQRWTAWNLLLDSAQRSDPSGSWAVDYLETMAMEYAEEPERARDALRRLAELHEGLRRYDKAVGAWEQYCLLPGLEDEENADIQRRLARLHMERREFDAAEDALRICVALSVNDMQQAECLYDQASLAAMREQSAKAVELARSIRALPGADAGIRARAGFILADILEEQGKHADALKLFREIREAYPNEMVVDYRIQALSKK